MEYSDVARRNSGRGERNGFGSRHAISGVFWCEFRLMVKLGVFFVVEPLKKGVPGKMYRITQGYREDNGDIFTCLILLVYANSKVIHCDLLVSDTVNFPILQCAKSACLR